MGMEIMGGLSALGGGLVGYVVPFLFVLTIVVFFHELGHFLMARWCGIKVLVFSIGFGPEIAGFNDRYGTRWKISAVPLGGYVKFFGDDNAASAPDQCGRCGDDRSGEKGQLHFQPVGSRAAVVAAGPIANFVLAIAIFAGIFMTVGKQTTSARVDTVQPGSAAQAAGFKPGDLVLSINGEKIESFSDMQRIVSISAGDTLTIEVDRGGRAGNAQGCAAAQGNQGQFRQRHRLGVLGISRSMAPGDIKTEKAPPLRAIVMGAQETWFVVDRTLSYISGVFTGPGSGRSARRTDPDRAGIWTGSDRRIRRPDSPDSGAVSVHRPTEFVPDTTARWGSPFVLRYRERFEADRFRSAPRNLASGLGLRSSSC